MNTTRKSTKSTTTTKAVATKRVGRPAADTLYKWATFEGENADGRLLGRKPLTLADAKAKVEEGHVFAKRGWYGEWEKDTRTDGDVQHSFYTYNSKGQLQGAEYDIVLVGKRYTAVEPTAVKAAVKTTARKATAKTEEPKAKAPLKVARKPVAKAPAKTTAKPVTKVSKTTGKVVAKAPAKRATKAVAAPAKSGKRVSAKTTVTAAGNRKRRVA